MIRPSPELMAVSRRWYKAIVNKNEKGLRNLLSDREYLRFVGSADSEIWGGSSVRQAIGRHFAEVPIVTGYEE